MAARDRVHDDDPHLVPTTTINISVASQLARSGVSKPTLSIACNPARRERRMDDRDDLAAQIAAYPVPPGQAACWWLGGSGFVLKSPGGTQVYIDPYLSDSVQAIFGQGRAFPTPIAPEQARPDVLIVTHWHEDHLDPGTIPLIARH